MHSSVVLLMIAAAVVLLILNWLRVRSKKMNTLRRLWDRVAFNETLEYERRKRDRETERLREKHRLEIRGYQGRICQMRIDHAEETENAVRSAVATVTALYEVDRQTTERLLRQRLRRERARELGRLIAQKEQEAFMLANEGQYTAAYAAMNQVLGFALVSGCAFSVASAKHNLGILLGSANDDFEQAVALIQEAIKLVEGHEHTDDCPPRGVDAQNGDDRLDTYRKHLKEYQHKLLVNQCHEVQSQGVALMRGGYPRQSIRYFQTAIELAVEAGSRFLEFGNMVNLATAFGNCDSFDRAFAILAKARLIAETLGDDSENLIEVVEQTKFTLEVSKKAKPFHEMINKVERYGRRNQHGMAEKAARDALKEARKSFGPRHYLTAAALDYLGVALAKQQKLGAAVECLQGAVDIAGDWQYLARGIGVRATRNLASVQAAMDE